MKTEQASKTPLRPAGIHENSTEGAKFDSPGRSAAEPWVPEAPYNRSPNGATFPDITNRVVPTERPPCPNPWRTS